MRKLFAITSFVSFLLPTLAAFITTAAHADTPTREWTFLVYLNGNNSLDSFGPKDLKEMEKVGSTDKVAVVVQWASLANSAHTKRMLMQKGTGTTVSSPVVQDAGDVDMGDYRSLVEFVRWGVANYPAKHYFIDVWNHGNGWHRAANSTVRDLSYDDHTDNHFTTEQLGLAMTASAQIIGHKVDLYGTDACLMAMAEVAGEVADSVEAFAGSEEVEPGPGWAYDALLTRMNSDTDTSPLAVGKALAETYLKSYQGGSQGTQDVTFSVFDLTKFDAFSASMNALGAKIAALSAADRKKLLAAAKKVQTFTLSDYADLTDFLTLAEKAGVSGLTADANLDVRSAITNFVTTNQVTSAYSKAKGLAIWLPTSKSTYNTYADRYKGLKFDIASKWDVALTSLLQ